MIVEHHYEPETMSHVVTLRGRDSAGNDLETDVQLLIKMHENKEAVECHAVEALIALLRGIDDCAVRMRAVDDGNSDRMRNVGELWQEAG
ncbi:hypothetical protein [Neptunomonas sp.]|uniref:hypothetical protein n=1 Tax=Neptunomonas sp. TaxID=1971898 RepID=UPI00356A76D8